MLEEINPDVTIDGFDLNITSLSTFNIFLSQLKTGSLLEKPVDMVLCCVDNFDARFAVNQACLELDMDWMESGVAEDSMSSHIQLLIPGVLACFECAPPLISASGIPESTLKREGVCSASLPTTMTITAALLVQNTLKYLLQFGKVSFYQGYIAFNDFFPYQSMRPNTFCSNKFCLQRQNEKKGRYESLEQDFDFTPKQTLDNVLHSENPYNIVIEDSSDTSEFFTPSTQQPKLDEKKDQERLVSLRDKLKMLSKQ